MITKENWSIQAIMDILGVPKNVQHTGDEAYFSGVNFSCNGVDTHRTIIVKACPRFIVLSTFVGVSGSDASVDLLEVVNRVNARQPIPRIYVENVGVGALLVMEYAIPLGDGVSKDSLMYSMQILEVGVRQVLPVFAGQSW